MRKKIAAGNWKMYKTLAETRDFFNEFIPQLPHTSAEVIIAPSFTNLATALELTQHSVVNIAAQNLHQAQEGAYTGEVSAPMLQSIGVQTVILGHSERRQYFGETAAILAQKTDTSLAHGMRVIFCIGEKLDERKAGKHFDIVKTQLQEALFHLDTSAWKQIVLAYEPVWAIGTGETATPEQAQEMHAYIRLVIAQQYGAEVAQNVQILYGGSVKPDNAAQLFSKPDVDGGLVGGASLHPGDFITIINAAG